MLRRKFCQLIASATALIGAGAAHQALKRGELAISLFPLNHNVWDINGDPSDVAEFYHLWQEDIWPGYATNKLYHKYVGSDEELAKSIASGRILIHSSSFDKKKYERAFWTALTRYSGSVTFSSAAIDRFSSIYVGRTFLYYLP